MDILFSVLEFAASYNCYTNLRLRMHQIPAERFPLNLLRQELAETCIYLDILQKTTTRLKIKGKSRETGVSQNGNILLVANDTTSLEQNKDEQLQGIAEEKLVSCRCFQRAIDCVVITVGRFQKSLYLNEYNTRKEGKD